MTNYIKLKDVLGTATPSVEIMDIGAMIAGEDRYRTIVDQGLARITGFEPNPVKLSELNANAGPHQYYAHVLGDGNPGTFYQTRYPGCSSLFEPNGDLINMFAAIGAEPGYGNFAVDKTFPTETVRLDDLTEVTAPDFLKLDIQGAEHMVLENARKTISDTLVIQTEAEFVEIYKNQPLFGDLQKLLTAQGFMLHKLIDVEGRTLRPLQPRNANETTSQLLWADAIFVRSYVDLTSYSDEQLLKAALILNDVYFSYDIVHRLLVEHDKRQQTPFEANYITALRETSGLPKLYLNLKDT